MIRNCLPFAGSIMLVMVVCIGAAPQAFGDAATDIQVGVSSGKITTNLSKYAGAFDTTTFETDAPGFAGSPTAGFDYGVQVAQKLWYHSGIEGDPVTPVADGVSVSIFDGTNTRFVTGTSGLQSGLMLAENLSGSLHAHLDFVLSPNTAPTGVYGLVLQVTSPSFQSSDPFLLAIANINGLNLGDPAVLEGIEYGEQAIFNAAVPEPSSAALAGLGVAGLAGAVLRRRMRKRSPRLRESGYSPQNVRQQLVVSGGGLA
jgi:hypothetical protein